TTAATRDSPARQRLRLAGSRPADDERAAASGIPGDARLMADFLTRLIGRSRGLALQGRGEPQVQPLIAPLFAAGPNTRSPEGMNESAVTEELASVTELESRSWQSAERV